LKKAEIGHGHEKCDKYQTIREDCAAAWSLDQVDVVMKEQFLQGTSFEDCLLSLGFMSESALAEALSSTSGQELILTNPLDPSLKSLLLPWVEEYVLIPS
jgi:hypothetical protein